MTIVNREHNFNSIPTTLQDVLDEWSRSCLHTAMPGIIDGYDVETRRARVRPALRLVLTGDRPGEDGEAMEQALSVNVPVMWAAGGGLVSGFPLEAGDRGMLVFSERGMTVFKQTGELATPDKARFFDESDGVFFPGDFGHPSLTPYDAAAAFLQTYDSNTALTVKEDQIRFRVGSTTLTVVPAGMTLVTPSGTQRWGT